MVPTTGGGSETSIDRAIDARLASLDAGNYRANNDLVLSVFADYLAEQRDVTRLDDLDVLDCRRYAQWLRRRARDDTDDLSAASVHANGPYFTVVRAFLGWCVDDERIDRNPARPNRVKDALPEFHGDRDRQFWSAEDREALLSYARKRAANADTRRRREQAYRDQAITTTLALTGVRGAEVFADPRDDDRDGIRWSDLDLSDGVAVVFGKTRERQAVPLTDRVIDALVRYRRVLDPAGDDWPVFPTRHAPSLSRAVRSGLGDRGWMESDVEAALEESSSVALLREHGIAPPALSKNGARSLLKRLCADADLDIDGEYLKPHGGRRGIGSELYGKDTELAQELLRHESIETTHESYREQRVLKRKARLEDALDSE